MKLLVTGGAGFIGSNFIHYWLKKYSKDKIINLDKLTYAGNLANLKDVADNPNYRFVKGDICNGALVGRVMKSIEVVAHFAAESVSADTLVPIHNGRKIELLDIEKLFGRYKKIRKVKKNRNGTEIIKIEKNSQLRALSFKSGMGCWCQITHISRHKYEGEIILLSQKWGEVEITPNHSVYNCYGQLVSAASNSELLSIRKINLDKSRFKNKIKIELPKASLRGKKNKFFWKEKLAAPKQVWVFREYQGKKLKALLRFLGAYIAEGNATYNKANGSWLVNISSRNIEYLKSIQKDVSLFSNITSLITRRDGKAVNQLVFNGRIFYMLTTHLCRRYSHSKKIPNFVYTLRDEFKKELLNSYLKGDGNVEKYKTVDSKRFTTTSRYLATGFGFLLSLLGEDFSFHSRISSKKNHKKSYNFRIVSHYDSVCNSKKIRKRTYEGYVYDLTVEDTHNFVAGIGNIVVHNTHVDRSITGPQIFLKTNVIGTQVLLDAALKYKVKRFHHISTDEVFGALPLHSKKKFNEMTRYDPHSPYAASKAASDHLVRAYATTFGLPITITNCSNNYGPYQFPEKFLPLMITNLIEGKKIPIYGDGLYVRDWLYVEDHCRAIDLVIQKGKVGETYCVGGMTKDFSNLEVVKKICRIMGKKLKDSIEFVKDRPGHDRRYAVDWSKIKKKLGWQPKYDFRTGLRKTVSWYRENVSWRKPLKKKALL